MVYGFDSRRRYFTARQTHCRAIFLLVAPVRGVIEVTEAFSHSKRLKVSVLQACDWVIGKKVKIRGKREGPFWEWAAFDDIQTYALRA